MESLGVVTRRQPLKTEGRVFCCRYLWASPEHRCHFWEVSKKCGRHETGIQCSGEVTTWSPQPPPPRTWVWNVEAAFQGKREPEAIVLPCPLLGASLSSETVDTKETATELSGSAQAGVAASQMGPVPQVLPRPSAHSSPAGEGGRPGGRVETFSKNAFHVDPEPSVSQGPGRFPRAQLVSMWPTGCSSHARGETPPRPRQPLLLSEFVTQQGWKRQRTGPPHCLAGDGGPQ